jgi:hypothetical protein
MDQDRQQAGDASGQVKRLTMPTGGRVLLRTLPAAVVLIIGLPIYFWWRYDALEDHKFFELLLTIAYYMLAFTTVGRTRGPLPEPANQFPREHVGWTLSTAPRTVAVPQDPDLRIAIGVAATSRIRTAALTSIAALTAATTGWVHSVPFFLVLATILGVLALVFIARARRSWTYLNKLHAEKRTR